MVIDQRHQLHRKRQKNEEAVKAAEKKQSIEYKTQKQIRSAEVYAIELKKKQDKMNEMRQKKRVRIGKQPMFRSAKINMEKKVEKKEINPERQAIMDYLGPFDEIDELMGNGP